jgi:PAS domain S-box-containing protein
MLSSLPAWQPTGWQRYALALAAVLSCFALRLLLDPVLGTVSPVLIFMLAIFVSATFGGFGPGLLATVASGFAASWFFADPAGDFGAENPTEQVRILLFALIGVAASALGEARLRAERRRDADRLELEHTTALLRAVSESSPGLVFAKDREGRMLLANAEVLRLMGRPWERVRGRTDLELHHDEKQARAIMELDRGVIASGEARTVEEPYDARDGTRRIFLSTKAPLRDADGAIIGLVGVSADITQRKALELRVRESERRLHAVLNNATVAVFMMDERQQCVYMNEAAERLTGYSFAETEGRPLHEVVHHTRPDGTRYPIEECPIDRAFPQNNQEQGEEIFVHKDGTFYPVAFTASPVRDESTRVIGTVIEVRDIRAEKAALATLREREQHLRLLVGELAHRVKNTLAIVQSIASQTLRGADSLEEFRAVFGGRLGALAISHDLLLEASWESIDLRTLVERTLAPLAPAERVVIEGPPTRVTANVAVSFGMALNELATNAMKYGALSRPGGRVEVRWRSEPASRKRIELRWRERGGPPVEPPQHRGFGSRLLEQLGLELGAELRVDFAREGVEVTVSLPVA